MRSCEEEYKMAAAEQEEAKKRREATNGSHAGSGDLQSFGKHFLFSVAGCAVVVASFFRACRRHERKWYQCSSAWCVIGAADHLRPQTK